MASKLIIRHSPKIAASRIRCLLLAVLFSGALSWPGTAAEAPSGGALPRGPGGIPSFFVPGPGGDGAPAYVLRNGELTAALYGGEVALASQGSVVRLSFPGARQGASPAGTDPLPGEANILMGSDPSEWRTGLPVFGGAVYREIYAGVEMRILVDGRRIKREFVVAAGADPSLIRMRFDGVESIRVEQGGGLSVKTAGGYLREEAPVIFQTVDGAREYVEGAFALLDDATVGFRLGAYASDLPLVIDPTLSFSTFLAGNGTDSATTAAVDSFGNTYIAGWTGSINFPPGGSIQAVNRGGVDAFVLKLDGTGNQLVFATYLGGSGDDRASSVKVDSPITSGWPARLRLTTSRRQA